MGGVLHFGPPSIHRAIVGRTKWTRLHKNAVAAGRRLSGPARMNRLKGILNDQTIRENRAPPVRMRKENRLDGVPPDKGK
ncbi:hypothetical protein A33K_13050 [Burkholderia humptydooensis MSMB43]|uniref:Uncharacterized protein n=1 Tax=Burkholderia humptydooensis MSMB43 TaxID=441157 RepID=A0ABN0GB86_9BURK|nr:hypothetical protein A33K_13050 [Burkholderia humptydooensis MSMB43]